jgi:hypothetical protein
LRIHAAGDGGADEAFDGADCRSWPIGNVIRHREDLGHQGFGCDNLVDHAEFERFCRLDPLGREQECQRPLRPHEAVAVQEPLPSGLVAICA